MIIFIKKIFAASLQDILIMFALNPMLEPGDTVTLEMEYDANVNYNVLGGYGETVIKMMMTMMMMVCRYLEAAV